MRTRQVRAVALARWTSRSRRRRPTRRRRRSSRRSRCCGRGRRRRPAPTLGARRCGASAGAGGASRSRCGGPAPGSERRRRGDAVAVELTTVADDAATFHDGTDVDHVDGLEPDTEYERHGITFRTLRPPAGPAALPHRARSTTSTSARSRPAASTTTPRARSGASRPAPTPYPETMNRAAVAEMAAADLAAVIVKGDLTTDGEPTRSSPPSRRATGPAFGDRLHVVRGNHDAYRGQDRVRRRRVDRAAAASPSPCSTRPSRRRRRAPHRRAARLARRRRGGVDGAGRSPWATTSSGSPASATRSTSASIPTPATR